MTMKPSGTGLVMNLSNSSDDVYVSNTYAVTTIPLNGSNITICKPL